MLNADVGQFSSYLVLSLIFNLIYTLQISCGNVFI